MKAVGRTINKAIYTYVPNEDNYEYIKETCSYYLLIWGINRELLDMNFDFKF